MHNNLEVQRKSITEPAFIKDFKEYGQIFHIHFSPYEWSKNVMLLAFNSRVLFAHFSFQDTLLVEKLYEFSHSNRCTTCNLSPNTSLISLPYSVIFATGGIDNKIRIFESDLKENNSCRVISGHSNYINDITYDIDNFYLASASDDNSVKIWNVNDDYTLKSTFQLSSPAMVVAFHRADPGKLLIAEKIGLIQIYFVEREIPILSLDFSKSLISAHWAPSDSLILGTLQLGELLLWDLAKPCLPQQSTTVFSENGGNIKFSSQGELLAAVNSLEGKLKVIHTSTQNVKLNINVQLPTNVQWHYHYPIVCVGDDTKLYFWKITGL